MKTFEEEWESLYNWRERRWQEIEEKYPKCTGKGRDYDKNCPHCMAELAEKQEFYRRAANLNTKYSQQLILQPT
ncbi:MAG: hypothetical protein FWG68_01415 [Defluviitaleaceae bacterium]|nr:hypothetical protein [Defluviitaleaceae bacterium]